MCAYTDVVIIVKKELKRDIGELTGRNVRAAYMFIVSVGTLDYTP